MDPVHDVMLRRVLKNQRLMMLALSNLVRENTRAGNVYDAENLSDAVREMEKNWDWIAPPSQRI